MIEKTQTEQILELAQNEKMLRAKDLAQLGLSRSALYNLVESNRLIQVERGLYVLPNHELSDHQQLRTMAKLAPRAIVCLLSALEFHELTTQNPFEVWLALERKTRVPRVAGVPLRTVFFSGAAFSAGIETHLVAGAPIRVYSPAKTVADCFKYRHKIGLDVALEALRDAWRQRRATMDELWHFAKVCRMSNVMRPYLESLV